MPRRSILVVLFVMFLASPAAAISLGSTTFDFGSFGGGSTTLPTALLVRWGPCPCGPSDPHIFDTIGPVYPSQTPQTFSVSEVDDPDFSTAAAALTDHISQNFRFDALPDPSPGPGGNLTGLSIGFNALHEAQVERFDLTIAPFTFAFVGGLPSVMGIGGWGSPLLIRVEAFGSIPAASVPEPSTLLIAGLGLVLLVMLRARWKAIGSLALVLVTLLSPAMCAWAGGINSASGIKIYDARGIFVGDVVGFSGIWPRVALKFDNRLIALRVFRDRLVTFQDLGFLFFETTDCTGPGYIQGSFPGLEQPLLLELEASPGPTGAILYLPDRTHGFIDIRARSRAVGDTCEEGSFGPSVFPTIELDLSHRFLPPFTAK